MSADDNNANYDDDDDYYDVRQAFDALDEEKDDVISLPQLETILLGLGLADRTDSLLLERQLSEAAQGVSDVNSIDLETVLAIIRAHYPRKDDGQAFIAQTFRLVDTGNKGYIDAHDVQQLGQDVGVAISKKQAKDIVACSSATTRTGNDKLDAEEFGRLFAPPSKR